MKFEPASTQWKDLTGTASFDWQAAAGVAPWQDIDGYIVWGMRVGFSTIGGELQAHVDLYLYPIEEGHNVDSIIEGAQETGRLQLFHKTVDAMPAFEFFRYFASTDIVLLHKSVPEGVDIELESHADDIPDHPGQWLDTE